jgi:protein TonB
MFKNLKYLPLLLTCIGSSISLLAQDTTFYNEKGKVVKSLAKAETFVLLKSAEPVKRNDDYVLSYQQNKAVNVSEETYYKNKQLIDSKIYSSYPDNIVEGVEKKWYPDGHPKAIVHYRQDTLTDSLITWWDNGKIRRRDKYDKMGKLLGGTCYDSSGNVIPHFDYKKAPVFTYYKGDIDYYFQTNVHYPQTAEKNGIAGNTIASFIIEKDGSMTNIMIIKSSDDRDLDNAVIDVFTKALMPLWKPGTEDGEPVKVRYTYPVKFHPGW